MSRAANSLQAEGRRRSLSAGWFFPPLQVRGAIALIATFFPYGVFYSLPYPGPELLLFLLWFWVFPSRLGFLFLLLLPVVPSETYGYYAFNLFCAGESFSIALAAMRNPELSGKTISALFRPALWCAFFALLLCVFQAMSGGHWWATVPGQSVPAGRGSGLRSEPSLLAGPLMGFICLLLVRLHAPRDRRRQKGALFAGLMLILGFIAVTRSLSVVVVVLAFSPLVLLRRRRLWGALAGGVAAGFVCFQLFGDRIEGALSSGTGTLVEAMTIGVDSWRNIPDFIVIANAPAYLWPGNPLEVRAKLGMFAAAISPVFAWLNSTYSMFSACVTSVGLLITAVLMVSGLVVALRCMHRSARVRMTWIALYLVCWFFAPKYDVIGWVALGVFPWGYTRAVRHEAATRRSRPAAAEAAIADLPAPLGSSDWERPPLGLENA